MNTYIQLEGIHIYAYHGVSEQEQIVGNNYEISLKVELPLSLAMESDQLQDTISYADLYELIKYEMIIPSKLLEHVVGRIIRSIKSSYPQISGIELKLTKHNPPIIGDIKQASVIFSEFK